MKKTFFSSKEAAKIAGCTLRQLQYWREKGIIVPVVNATGTGRSVYYSYSELVELILMEYLLSVGLSFEMAAHALEMLKQQEPNFFNPAITQRLMLLWNRKTKRIELKQLEREKAIAALDDGLPVIPVWLDLIHQHLTKDLEKLSNNGTNSNS